MFHINLKEIAAVVAAGYLLCKNWWDKIAPVLTPVVKEVEQMALDGKIDMADRKKIAMDIIAQLEINGTIKLSYLQKLLVSMIVDALAKRLPDFSVSKEITGVIDRLPK
jgi:hypothetical protein